jgi:putative DNA primase/helicase
MEPDRTRNRRLPKKEESGMTVDEAIREACSTVGIEPPKSSIRYGRWMQTNTLAGKNGKGDGRVIVNDANVTAFNWQSGQNATVFLNGEVSHKERRDIAEQVEWEKRRQRERAVAASALASRLVEAATPATHAYLARKGFPEEKALVLGAADILRLAADPERRSTGEYLVPAGGERAIVMPARIGMKVTSVQLVWEDGTKKFLFGGEISGASYRISKGPEFWLCEGFATGLSLRAGLQGLRHPATILCCFSAGNVLAVSRSLTGRKFIVADNDKPLPQYGGLGAGEYFARQADCPYLMPPKIGDDINDAHMGSSIFAVQRLLADTLRSAH